MVEEDTVGGEDAVGLTVITRDPVGVDLRDTVRAARVEGCRLGLRHLDDFAVELGSGSLVDADLLFHLQDADGLEEAERANAVGVGGILRDIEGDLHMGHRAEVIDFVGLDVADDADEVGRIPEVSVVELDLLRMDVADEVLHVEVLDA